MIALDELIQKRRRPLLGNGLGLAMGPRLMNPPEVSVHDLSVGLARFGAGVQRNEHVGVRLAGPA